METFEIEKDDLLIIRRGRRDITEKIPEKRTLILLDDKELKKFRELASGKSKTRPSGTKKEKEFKPSMPLIILILVAIYFILSGGKF